MSAAVTASDFDQKMTELKNYGLEASVIESIRQLQFSCEDVDAIICEITNEVKENKIKSDNESKNLIQQTEDETQQKNTMHLWDMADEHIVSMMYSRTSIYLGAMIGGQNCNCFLDTGAQNNIITTATVKKYGLESFVDKSYRGKVVGVGESNIIGCIPYLTLNVDGSECPCYFQVMEKVGSIDILLGLPFIMFYGVTLDFAKRKMTIGGKIVEMIIKE